MHLELYFFAFTALFSLILRRLSSFNSRIICKHPKNSFRIQRKNLPDHNQFKKHKHLWVYQNYSIRVQKPILKRGRKKEHSRKRFRIAYLIIWHGFLLLSLQLTKSWPLVQNPKQPLWIFTAEQNCWKLREHFNLFRHTIYATKLHMQQPDPQELFYVTFKYFRNYNIRYVTAVVSPLWPWAYELQICWQKWKKEAQCICNIERSCSFSVTLS